MKILITGVNGLVGSIIKESLSTDYEVVGVDIEEMDIRNIYLVHNVFVQHTFDVVIHCAALKDINESFIYKENYFKTNVIGTQNLLEIADKYKVPKFIFMSSNSICFSRNPYTFFKEISEYDVLNRKYGIGICLRLESVLRTFGVYSVNKTSLLDNMLRTYYGYKEVFELYGNNQRRFITPELLTNKIIDVLDINTNQIVSFESPICISTYHILCLFQEHIGKINYCISERDWETNLIQDDLNVNLYIQALQKIKNLPLKFLI